MSENESIEEKKEEVAVPVTEPAVEKESAPKKKTWMYVLFGCLGVFVVISILLGGFVWYATTKVRDKLPELEADFQREIEKELESGDFLNQDDFSIDSNEFDE